MKVNDLGAAPSLPASNEQPTGTSAVLGLVPKLRFPEFRDHPSWQSRELHSIASPVSERAGNEDSNNILTLSGEHGLVLQSEYFGKQIAGTNSERYLKIQRNDFVYNDRTTKASEYGTIKRLSKHPHGIVSPIYKCFRFNDDQHPDFWEWYFESGAHEVQLRSLANEGARAGRFNVSIDRFLSTRAHAPESSSGEQQKIAECLSTLDGLIGAESQKLDALKAHKKGLMQQLFPREGETLPRLRFPEFQDAPEWEEFELGEWFSPIRNGFVGTATPHYVESGGIKYLQGKNIKRGRIETDGLMFIREAFHQRQAKSHLKVGDLLMVQSGHVGECAVVPVDFAGCNCHALIILTPQRTLNSEFFVHYFYSPIGELAIFHITTGNTIKHILASEMKALKVLVPSLAEQHRIASCLSSLDDLIAAQRNRIDALKTHKQGLMQQLFPSPSAEAGG